ncbi:MAG: aspartyl protease family protein, partial [Pseudomonadota bacterium]
MKTISRRAVIAFGLALGAVSRGSAADAAASAPFEVDAVGRPIVKVALGDKGTFRFFVDTGTTVGNIRQGLAEQLGLERASGMGSATLKGVQPISSYHAPQPITVGSIPIKAEKLIGS